MKVFSSTKKVILIWLAARVTDNDFVYILDDFTLEGRDRALHFLKQLKWHKTLILGNQDIHVLPKRLLRRAESN